MGGGPQPFAGADTPLMGLGHARGPRRTRRAWPPALLPGGARRGLLSCFLQPLSSCSVNHITWDELRAVRRSREGGRAVMHTMPPRLPMQVGRMASTTRLASKSRCVGLCVRRTRHSPSTLPSHPLPPPPQDARRRSPAAYHLPRGVLQRPDAPYPRHAWAAALAAYAFRLQPRVAEAFERTRRGWAGRPTRPAFTYGTVSRRRMRCGMREISRSVRESPCTCTK